MTDDYPDSKGIGHTSDSGREMANQRYLDEERTARAQIASFQKEQSQLLERQAEASAEAAREARRQSEVMERMAREAEIQRREEESHRREMRDFNERALANQERQNRFERDLLFLEKENPADRKAYVIKRVSEDMERGCAYLDPRVPVILPEGPAVKEVVLTQLNLRLPQHEREIAELRELSRQRSQYTQPAPELEARRLQLVVAEGKNTSSFVSIGCAVLGIFGALFIAGVAWMNWEKQHDSFAVTLAGLVIFIAIVVIVRSIGRRASAHLDCGADPAILLRDRFASVAQKEKQASEVAVKEDYLRHELVRSLIQESQEPIIAELVSSQISPRWYCEKFRERVDLFQSDIPKSLRINPCDITEQDLNAPYSDFVNDLLRKCVSQDLKDTVAGITHSWIWQENARTPGAKTYHDKSGRPYFFAHGNRVYIMPFATEKPWTAGLVQGSTTSDAVPPPLPSSPSATAASGCNSSDLIKIKGC